MTRYAALLRAVNVGGTGKLAMSDLVRLCGDAGLRAAKTYIASGNVVFSSEMSASGVKESLEGRLEAFVGKRIPVFVRDEVEMSRVLCENPFAGREARFTHVVFLDEPPAPDALVSATGIGGEEVCLGAQEIYIHYPNGSGRSKLRIPAASSGTARNMNTVAKLAGLMSVGDAARN